MLYSGDLVSIIFKSNPLRLRCLLLRFPSASKLLMWRVDNCEVLCQHPCPSAHEKIAHLCVSGSAHASLNCDGGSTPLAFGTTLGRIFTAHIVFPPLDETTDDNDDE